MNQLFRSTAPAPESHMQSARAVRGRPIDSSAVVEYDDGNPATIAAAAHRRDPAPAAPSTDCAAPCTPLAAVPRTAATDYDDGDPATIVC